LRLRENLRVAVQLGAHVSRRRAADTFIASQRMLPSLTRASTSRQNARFDSLGPLLKFVFRTYAARWTAWSRVFMTFREPWPCRPGDKTC